MLFQYETDRLILQVIKPELASSVLDFYLRDKELFEQFETDRIPDFYTVKKQKQIAVFEYNAAIKGQFYRFYAFPKNEPKKIIGTISFHDIQYGYASRCEIGYKFSSDYHHMGYATEALSRIVEAIFTEMNLNRIAAWVLPENIASANLLKRVGFTREGCCRSYMYIQGMFRDHDQYAITRSDYTAR